MGGRSRDEARCVKDRSRRGRANVRSSSSDKQPHRSNLAILARTTEGGQIRARSTPAVSEHWARSERTMATSRANAPARRCHGFRGAEEGSRNAMTGTRNSGIARTRLHGDIRLGDSDCLRLQAPLPVGPGCARGLAHNDRTTPGYACEFLNRLFSQLWAGSRQPAPAGESGVRRRAPASSSFLLVERRSPRPPGRLGPGRLDSRLAARSSEP